MSFVFLIFNIGIYFVVIIDEIEKFSVESLYGAQVQHPTIFNTVVRGRHMTASNIGNVHYVWHFGDEVSKSSYLIHFFLLLLKFKVFRASYKCQ